MREPTGATCTDPDFNKHMDGGSSTNPDDMLIVPVPVAPDMSQSPSSRPDSGNSAATTTERQDARQIVAVLQVSLPICPLRDNMSLFLLMLSELALFVGIH